MKLFSGDRYLAHNTTPIHLWAQLAEDLRYFSGPPILTLSEPTRASVCRYYHLQLKTLLTYLECLSSGCICYVGYPKSALFECKNGRNSMTPPSVTIMPKTPRRQRFGSCLVFRLAPGFVDTFITLSSDLLQRVE